MKRDLLCKVIEKVKINENIYKLTIEKPNYNKNIKAGQFFNFKCGEGDYPLLRRPISVALVKKDSIDFYINKVGKGTNALCEKKEGDYIDILGPLGNGFDLDIKGKNIVIIGGGIGVAPLLELTKQLSDMHVNIDVMLGFKKEAFIVDEFKKYTGSVSITLENGSEVNKGYVTNLLKERIKSKKYDYIFTCGPKPMLKEVKRIGEEENIKTQLLMEERMACGIGACLVCTCKVKRGKDDWNYVRTCKEGPVFYGDEVIFDE
ncbi:dihydroorotate dehydrogenase electron transfer subunit [Caminicella sporogenes]|uniref:dihydroorotate dehydrogenase electron transfer subunit n=1 Tax=Caminicella sporogenes TaxID=166485 RepID=UPI00253F7B9D|nr:dihydroorotate dehydrogenase electron transfer subunit [Caminicella sporogenes]WIF95704.1 dihydroorotate dehydrogenase electron transfer subunit [Caminicella sporogenes]